MSESKEQETAASSPDPTTTTNTQANAVVADDKPVAQSAPPPAASSSRRMSKGVSRRESFRRRSSGLFAAARASFYRTRGKSGASVETLRGTSGADFEGYATVHRGDGDGVFSVCDLSCLFCCGKKKDGLCFVLIKGYHCFVFKDEEGKSPIYAIELQSLKAVLQPSQASLIPRVSHPGASYDTTYTTIHLETGLGDVEYKLTFANIEDELASKFCNAVVKASNDATTEAARKRLGHAALLGSKRGSVRYANTIGAEKTKDQPEAPIGAGEVMAGMPSPEY